MSPVSWNGRSWRLGRRHGQVRRDCARLLASLDLPRKYDISLLCTRLSEQRGRPIQLVPMTLRSDHVYGAWIASDDADYIIYETDTSRPHQEHIIAHEIAHMLCGHRMTDNIAAELAEVMFPDLDRKLVRDMLLRSGYSNKQEQEAEIVASALLARTNRRPVETTWSVPAEAADTIARMERSLTGRHTRRIRSTQHDQGEHDAP